MIRRRSHLAAALAAAAGPALAQPGGAVAARHEGCFDRCVEVVFRDMWREPKKMDEPKVIRAVLAENGLDAARLLERAQSPEVKQELVRDTEASVARGTFGSPTFFVGEEMFFGKDQLRDVEEECLRRRARPAAAMPTATVAQEDEGCPIC